MDEMFEALTLIQTRKMPWFPVVIVGKEFWSDYQKFVDQMEIGGTISPEDKNLYLVTDDLDEALDYIQEKVALMPRKKQNYRRFWWLGE
jgi:predicted Rossmann-fold nucleotide-binding protein